MVGAVQAALQEVQHPRGVHTRLAQPSAVPYQHLQCAASTGRILCHAMCHRPSLPISLPLHCIIAVRAMRTAALHALAGRKQIYSSSGGQSLSGIHTRTCSYEAGTGLVCMGPHDRLYASCIAGKPTTDMYRHGHMMRLHTFMVGSIMATQAESEWKALHSTSSRAPACHNTASVGGRRHFHVCLL